MNDFAVLTYHDYINESLSSFRQAMDESKKISGSIDKLDLHFLKHAIAMRYRYAFLMAANSLEAAANALLLSLNFSTTTQYTDIERLPTLLKFDLFCKFNHRDLNRGDIKYAHVKELISARNEFVHPKPKRIEYSISETNNIQYSIPYSKNKRYPLYLYNFEDVHVLNAFQDVFGFIGWICFYICNFSVQDGSLLLGLNSVGHNSDIYFIEEEYKYKFDKRSISIKN